MSFKIEYRFLKRQNHSKLTTLPEKIVSNEIARSAFFSPYLGIECSVYYTIFQVDDFLHEFSKKFAKFFGKYLKIF